MKLLGQFGEDEGNKYIDLLKVNSIEVELEDVYVEYNGLKGGSYTHQEVKLFVSEENYDEAMQKMKEYDLKQQKEVEVDAKEADKVMIRIVIGALIFLGIAVLFAYFRR